MGLKGHQSCRNYYRVRRRHMRMHPIVTAVKHRDRVEVRYRKDGETRRRCYTFEEVIAMEINVLDLLDHPHDYAIDPEKNRIYERYL